MNVEHPDLQLALQNYPTLGAHKYIAEAITLLGMDNHTSTCYYATAEYYLTKHGDKFNAGELDAACKLAYEAKLPEDGNHLELLAFGENSEVYRLLQTHMLYRSVDYFLDTVFGETEDCDEAAPPIGS